MPSGLRRTALGEQLDPVSGRAFTTLQWLVALAVLITFHTVYVTRTGLKV